MCASGSAQATRTCGAACRDWRSKFKKASSGPPTRATYLSSGGAGHTNQHSAYDRRFARVAYPYHPFFGQVLRASPNRRGLDLRCVYTEDKPGQSRELPSWMFDESYCASIDQGAPRVSIAALYAFAALLESLNKNRQRRARSPSSKTKEKGHAKVGLGKSKSTRFGSGAPSASTSTDAPKPSTGGGGPGGPASERDGRPGGPRSGRR